MQLSQCCIQVDVYSSNRQVSWQSIPRINVGKLWTHTHVPDSAQCWCMMQEAAAYFEMARLVNLVPSCVLVYLGAWVRVCAELALKSWDCRCLSW